MKSDDEFWRLRPSEFSEMRILWDQRKTEEDRRQWRHTSMVVSHIVRMALPNAAGEQYTPAFFDPYAAAERSRTEPQQSSEEMLEIVTRLNAEFGGKDLRPQKGLKRLN